VTESVGEGKATAEGVVWRFKKSLLRGSGAAGDAVPSGSSEQTHVGAGVREHVKRLGWKTRYDESTKRFDESLQKS